MGTLQLDCPLCCSETFPCHNSLKYHLLSISDNLICPACGKRFEKIIDLAMHLGRQCLDPECNPTDPSDILNEGGTEVHVYGQENNLLATELQIKEEVLENNKNNTEVQTVVTNSILAKALLKSTTSAKSRSNEILENTIALQNETDPVSKDDTSEEDVYYCSSCTISFKSVEDHLQEFHEGHEVFIEEEELMNTSLNDSPIPIIDDEPDDEDQCDNGVEILCAAELLDTVQEEECVDKDGRLYTRKVVKIEKFWDDEEVKATKPNKQNSVVTKKDNNFQEAIVLENIQTLAYNSKNNANLLEIYQCSKCEKKFPTLEHSSNHKCPALRVDSNKYKKLIPDPNPPFICEICNTEFSTYKSLRLHRRMHEPIKSKDIEPPVTYGMLGEELGTDNVPREMFICQICNKPYNKEYEEAHKKYHSKDVDFNCDICNRKFYTQENLDMHMRAHSDTKKFTCSYCKKGFLTNEKLEAHMSSKCQKRQYECQYCGRRFARPHEKVKHERIHTGEKPHVCEICGKAFRVSYCLTLHMRTHSGTRPYKCDHCGKRFKAHSVYNHHLLTHSEDRKYKCPFCPKTFKTGVQLAGHKNSHTKPFTCTECNRPFASLYAVRAHMETHQRQNNLKYRCWLCGASYARAFALRDHVREQHVGEHDNTTGTDAVILETDDYPMNENVEPNVPILVDADENMLIDIGSEAVDNMEIPDVQVESDLQDNNGT